MAHAIKSGDPLQNSQYLSRKVFRPVDFMTIMRDSERDVVDSAVGASGSVGKT